MSEFHTKLRAAPAVVMIVLLSGLAVRARTQSTPISFSNCSGGGGSDSLSGNCPVSPYGFRPYHPHRSREYGSKDYTVTLTFANGGVSFAALDTDQQDSSGMNFGDVNVTANITARVR
jgi:hypothetical protein